MLQALHRAGHKYLKLLFVVALAGSSALFFIGAAIPKPPALLVILIGAGLGVAVEWSYFTVSCDLTESITERDGWGTFRNGLFTLIGAGASWFLFVNAALHVGWAPTDHLTGLTQTQWAMIAGALVVGIVFVLSLHRQRPEHQTDLQNIARAVQLLLPEASNTVRLQLLATIATAAAGYDEGQSQAVAALPASPAPVSPVQAIPLPAAPAEQAIAPATGPAPAELVAPASLPTEAGDPFNGEFREYVVEPAQPTNGHHKQGMNGKSGGRTSDNGRPFRPGK